MTYSKAKIPQSFKDVCTFYARKIASGITLALGLGVLGGFAQDAPQPTPKEKQKQMAELAGSAQKLYLQYLNLDVKTATPDQEILLLEPAVKTLEQAENVMEGEQYGAMLRRYRAALATSYHLAISKSTDAVQIEELIKKARPYWGSLPSDDKTLQYAAINAVRHNPQLASYFPEHARPKQEQPIPKPAPQQQPQPQQPAPKPEQTPILHDPWLRPAEEPATTIRLSGNMPLKDSTHGMNLEGFVNAGPVQAVLGHSSLSTKTEDNRDIDESLFGGRVTLRLDSLEFGLTYGQGTKDTDFPLQSSRVINANFDITTQTTQKQEDEHRFIAFNSVILVSDNLTLKPLAYMINDSTKVGGNVRITTINLNDPLGNSVINVPYGLKVDADTIGAELGLEYADKEWAFGGTAGYKNISLDNRDIAEYLIEIMGKIRGRTWVASASINTKGLFDEDRREWEAPDAHANLAFLIGGDALAHLRATYDENLALRLGLLTGNALNALPALSEYNDDRSRADLGRRADLDDHVLRLWKNARDLDFLQELAKDNTFRFYVGIGPQWYEKGGKTKVAFTGDIFATIPLTDKMDGAKLGISYSNVAQPFEEQWQAGLYLVLQDWMIGITGGQLDIDDRKDERATIFGIGAQWKP